MLHAQKGAENVGVEGGGVAFSGLLRYRAGNTLCARVVNCHIQATEAFDSFVDYAPHVLFAPNVVRHEFAFCAYLAEFSKKFLASFLPPSGHNNARAFLHNHHYAPTPNTA